MKAKAILVGAVFGAIAGHILEEPIKNLVSSLRGGGSGPAPDPKSVSDDNRPKGKQ